MYGNKFIKDRMSKNRWKEIKDNLHPNIEKLMESLRTNNAKYYSPTKEVSVDETLFAFKGRVRFRQKMALKPAGTGLKYYILADARGFIIDAFLYKGKYLFADFNTKKGSATQELKSLTPQQMEEVVEKGATYNIVQYFITRLTRPKHVFILDKFYGGLNVMNLIQSNNHFGLLQCQAKRPAFLFEQTLIPGIYCIILFLMLLLQVFNKLMTGFGTFCTTKLNQ